MFTRFSKTTCPNCGKTDKPEVKAPDPSLLDLVPGVDLYRASDTVLQCRHCGHQLTESVQTKARGLFDRAKESAQAMIEEARRPPPPVGSAFCSACGSGITGKFCANCGTARG